MWLLTLFPYWVFDVVLVLGILGLVASYFVKFVPFINTYQLPLQLASLCLTVAAVWFQGGIENDKQWEAKIAELQKRVLVAEAKSAVTNTEIVTQTVKQIQVIRERGDTITKYIDREVVRDQEVIQFIENCEIPNIIVNAHNEATK
jgi:hypothetical protein